MFLPCFEGGERFKIKEISGLAVNLAAMCVLFEN
jgi:hypothetical protein